MTWSELRCLRDGHEPVIQVFVHGLRSVASERAFEELCGNILAARPAGKVYVFYWNSGNGRAPITYDAFERISELLGSKLVEELDALHLPRRWQVHLIGHSLGTRVIHYALAHHRRRNRRIDEVVLMAGAADAEDGDWPECIDRVNGRVTNLYNPWDVALFAGRFRTNRLLIGRNGIGWTHTKLTEYEVRFGHGDYWPNLERILTEYFPRWMQHTNDSLAGE